MCLGSRLSSHEFQIDRSSSESSLCGLLGQSCFPLPPTSKFHALDLKGHLPVLWCLKTGDFEAWNETTLTDELRV